MAFSSSSSHPFGTSENRFVHFTPDNHSAWIWVASLISLIYAIVVLTIRLGIIKRKTRGLDDIILTLAHLVGFGMWGSLFTSLNSGLGRLLEDLDDLDISQMQKSFFASRIMLFIGLALSKCSILILIQNIFTRAHKISHIINGTIAVVAIWGMVGVLGVFVGCSPTTILPKPDSNHCVSSIPWLKVVAVGDVLSEVVIVLLPIVGLYKSFMPVKRRITVVLAFSTRAPNIVFTLVHMLAYSRFISSHQPATGVASTAAWQSILLSYSLMSATIPSLKGFTQGFMTQGVALGYSERIPIGTSYGTQRSYELQSLHKSRSRSQTPPMEVTGSQVPATLVPRVPKRDTTGVGVVPKDETQCYHEENASITSHGSQQIMIKREFHVSSI